MTTAERIAQFGIERVWDDLSYAARLALLVKLGARDDARTECVARTCWLCLPDDVRARL